MNVSGALAFQAAAFIATAVAILVGVIAIGLIRDIRRLRQSRDSVMAERDLLARELDQIGATRARAEAANEAKSRFLATVSHEIRTPLNGVLGMADILLDTPLDAEQQNYGRAIKTSGEALLTLIEEILDFSRIEAGKLELHAHEVELTPLIEGVVELLAPRAQGKGIEIAAFIAPDLPETILADGGRLRQIVMNLAGNAVKFTEKGGVGLHAMRDRAGFLAITIEDTGPGIPPERQEAIFEEFEQVEAHAAPRHGGTGLGLAISRRLARAMGGDIRVESRTGGGTVFTLVLPLPASAAAAAEPDFAFAPGKVLVIAEGPFEGRYLAAYFTAAGSMPLVVESIEAGLDALAVKTPDLVVMDAAFGPEAAARLVAASRAAGCPRHLVLLSPFERRRFGAPAALGFDRYLVKPVRRRSLKAQINDWDRLGGGAPAIMESDSFVAEPLKDRRVLIAEDNDINALLAGRLIERLGGRSVRASNGIEALDLLHASLAPGAARFDCVLFDVRMPELDGLSAIRQWREVERERGYVPVPALALTANAFREDREACLIAGFDGFLPKPLDRDLFIATLDRLLAPSRAVA